MGGQFAPDGGRIIRIGDVVGGKLRICRLVGMGREVLGMHTKAGKRMREGVRSKDGAARV